MATTKKTYTTKKTPVTKKSSTASKKGGSKKSPPLTWRFYVVAIGIFLIAVTTVIVASYLAAGVVAKQNTQTRLDRINNIYSSLNLDDSYILRESNVFGDKRIDENDKESTLFSRIEYTHGDTVSNTVANLDAKIKAAGFTFVNEPYPGSAQVQYHYKSKDGEFIRLSVASKPYMDEVFNRLSMHETIPVEVSAKMDRNIGPASVTIKVNLDDNNEV